MNYIRDCLLWLHRNQECLLMIAAIILMMIHIVTNNMTALILCGVIVLMSHFWKV